MPLHNHALNMLTHVGESQLRAMSKHPRCAGKQATEMKMPAALSLPSTRPTTALGRRAEKGSLLLWLRKLSSCDSCT